MRSMTSLILLLPIVLLSGCVSTVWEKNGVASKDEYRKDADTCDNQTGICMDNIQRNMQINMQRNAGAGYYSPTSAQVQMQAEQCWQACMAKNGWAKIQKSIF